MYILRELFILPVMSAHKRMDEVLSEGKELPLDIKNQMIYYMGLSPAREGRPIGSAG